MSWQLACWPFQLLLYYLVLLIFPFSGSKRMRFAHCGEHSASPMVTLFIISGPLALCPSMQSPLKASSFFLSARSSHVPTTRDPCCRLSASQPIFTRSLQRAFLLSSPHSSPPCRLTGLKCSSAQAVLPCRLLVLLTVFRGTDLSSGYCRTLATCLILF